MKSRNMKSWGSSSGMGATRRSSPAAGAGELMHPGGGPGPAARRKMGIAVKEFAVASAPPGSASGPMDMYSEGAKPGRGYKYPTTR